MARTESRLRTGGEVIFDVQALAKQKHHESGIDRESWLRAFENARLTLKTLEVDYQALEYIAIASRTPEQFTVMIRLIYQYTKSNTSSEEIGAKILHLVNKSSFSLGDWIDSVDYFYQWLITNQKKIDFVPMLEYLECCVVSPDAKKGRQTLLALVEDMLDAHGYDAGG